MIKPPIESKITLVAAITPAWSAWFQRLWALVSTLDSSGTTANRPTKNLFVGRFYFDTTLGYAVWLKSVNPIVWVDSGGFSV